LNNINTTTRGFFNCFLFTFVFSMSLEAIKYSPGHLQILNQLLLPQKSIYERVKNTEDGWQAIRQMKARFEIRLSKSKSPD
jgi:hypothetical protein